MYCGFDFPDARCIHCVSAPQRCSTRAKQLFLSILRTNSHFTPNCLQAWMWHNMTQKQQGQAYLILFEKFPRSSAAPGPCPGCAALRSAGFPVFALRDRRRLSADLAVLAVGRNCPVGPRNLASSWWAPPWMAPLVPNWHRTCWWAVPQKKPKAQEEVYQTIKASGIKLVE